MQPDLVFLGGILQHTRSLVAAIHGTESHSQLFPHLKIPLRRVAEIYIRLGEGIIPGRNAPCSQPPFAYITHSHNMTDRCVTILCKCL